MINRIWMISVAFVILIFLPLHSVANANLIGLPDFDWPQYWEKHKDDETVTCAHIAFANALYYWDKKTPNLIPDNYGRTPFGRRDY